MERQAQGLLVPVEHVQWVLVWDGEVAKVVVDWDSEGEQCVLHGKVTLSEKEFLALTLGFSNAATLGLCCGLTCVRNLVSAIAPPHIFSWNKVDKF